MPEIIIPDTIETGTIMCTGGAPGIAMTGLATGTGIESRLAIVPMITTVGMGTIPGGTTGEMTGVGNVLRQSDSLSNGIGKSCWVDGSTSARSVVVTLGPREISFQLENARP